MIKHGWTDEGTLLVGELSKSGRRQNPRGVRFFTVSLTTGFCGMAKGSRKIRRLAAEKKRGCPKSGQP